MKNKYFTKISYNKIIWILTVCLLAGFIILEKYSWGKYLLLLFSSLIFIFDNQINRYSIIPLGPFQLSFGLFIVYSFMTALWALNAFYAIEFSVTLLFIYICLLLITPHYMRKNDISELLSAIMWASIIVAIYTISFYGVDTLIAASKTQYVRLGNDYSNINTIGMFCAFGVVIQFEKWLYSKKFQFSMLFVFISIFIVACTQSRKALLLMVIGCLMIGLMKDLVRASFYKSISKIIKILIGLVVFMLAISQISFFSGVYERLIQLFLGFTGVGELDSGSVHRQQMVKLGFLVWQEHPIFGVGLNCTRIIVKQNMGFDAYMHNNFIEILCASGIIGFLLYYGMYIYIFNQLLKYKYHNRRYYIFGIMWLVISLIMDIGMVSYYGKTQCFYLFVQFLNVFMIKHMPAIKSTKERFNNEYCQINKICM